LDVPADAPPTAPREQPALTCLLRKGRQWVVRPIGCRLLRGSVCDLVALEVAKVAPGPGLYQGWSFPPPGPSDGLAGGLVDGDHVVAINCDARDVVGGGAVCDARRRAVVADRRGFSELVVLTDDEHGQLPDCGQVHRLVCRALLGRTVTEAAIGNRAGAEALARQARPGRQRRPAAHDAVGAEHAAGDVSDVHGAILALAAAAAAPEQLSHHLARRDPFSDAMAVAPVRRGDVVTVVQVGAHSHGDRLLPRLAMDEAGDPAGC